MLLVPNALVLRLDAALARGEGLALEATVAGLLAEGNQIQAVP